MFKSTGKTNKQILSPPKVNLLWAIRDSGETNRKVIALNADAIGCDAKPGSIALHIAQFVKSGLVQYTGGGYFQITLQGIGYLDSLKTYRGASRMLG